MINIEVKWWETIQKPNLWWHHQKHLIPVFQLTEPSREPLFVYASPIQNVGGVDVTYLRTEVSHGLYVTYPEIPIEALRKGEFEISQIKGDVTVQVMFVGFMDDNNLQDKTWPQWL